MDLKELEARWDEKAKKLFDELMEETYGRNISKPGCFGSGNAKKFCMYCSYQDNC